MLPEEITKKILEQQLRDNINALQRRRRHTREYILEVSEKLSGIEKEEDDQYDK